MDKKLEEKLKQFPDAKPMMLDGKKLVEAIPAIIQFTRTQFADAKTIAKDEDHLLHVFVALKLAAEHLKANMGMSIVGMEALGANGETLFSAVENDGKPKPKSKLGFQLPDASTKVGNA